MGTAEALVPTRSLARPHITHHLIPTMVQHCGRHYCAPPMLPCTAGTHSEWVGHGDSDDVLLWHS